MRNDWLEVLGWDKAVIDDLRFAGYSYIKEGQYPIALKFFEPLAMITEEIYDLQTLGALHLQTGEYLSALNYLEKALQIDPTNAPTLLNRSKALFRLGYKRQGLVQARTLENNPDQRIASHASALVLTNS